MPISSQIKHQTIKIQIPFKALPALKKTLLTDDLHVDEPLDGPGHLQVPQTFGPFQRQGVSVELVQALAGFHLQVNVLVSVLEDDFHVHELASGSIGINFFRINIPVGHESSLNSSSESIDKTPHTAGHLE